MKAPEKIYVSPIAFETPLSPYVDIKNDGYGSIEYTRTDAFIEEVCKYLEPIIFSMNLGDRPDADKFIEDFKKHMKGE